jgi:hypothetical protein
MSSPSCLLFCTPPPPQPHWLRLRSHSRCRSRGNECIRNSEGLLNSVFLNAVK